MCGVHVLVSRRDQGFWYTRWNLPLLRVVALFVDRFVANSHAVKCVVQQREWVSGRKISVIYNGFFPRTTNKGGETEAEVLREVPPNVPVVGIVANLRPIKRIDTLIKAFAMVSSKFPDAYLAIVGSNGLSPYGGSMGDYLKKMAYRHGIRERVIFTGRVEDPKPYIDRFNVAVLCSESEGFSNSIVEYMQAGRPVVCTDTGGNPELVQDGRNGFLVPVGDTKVLAERILQLIADGALSHRLGEAARETVQSTCTHKRMVAEHMGCYDEVLLADRFRGKLH
jgi:glycosyltransferase involved in cell wall biosynthesis